MGSESWSREDGQSRAMDGHACYFEGSELSSRGCGALGGFHQHGDTIRFMFWKIAVNGEWVREARIQVGTVWHITWATVMTVRKKERMGGFQT